MKYYNDYFDDAGEENESQVVEELESPAKVAATITAPHRYLIITPVPSVDLPVVHLQAFILLKPSQHWIQGGFRYFYPAEERRDAMKFYNDYFDDAGEENEQQVIAELGDPAQVAAII
mgnify:CR=1 FL=1